MLKRIFSYAFSQNQHLTQKTKKMYILSQFPYPSGDLHLGHARVYYIGDSISTYYRLKNYKVIYPIGWDSFGLPAQNAAIIHGQNPKQWTQSNIQRMKQQLHHLKINFSWEMQLSTCSPQYYRWTQQIFVKMFKKGLAYKKMAEVNWDPVDKTVLANQQVDQNGFSWRSGAKVQKKMLNQWFLKITDFAQELQTNLDKLEWIQRVKNMQRGWIDFRNGYKLKMNLYTNQNLQNSQSKIEFFVQNIQSMKSAKFIVKKTDNISENKKDTLSGFVKNPYNNEILPVIHSALQQSQTYLLIQLKHIKNNQNYKQIYGKFKLLNTKQMSSVHNEQSIRSLINTSQKVTQLKLKDWLISRQRFWGCPIPIIYCKNCGAVPVPQDQLPIVLPEWKNDGNPLLKNQFKKCQCPKCGTESQRQSDTMDTFVDSSWYFLRFMDNENKQKIFSHQKVSQMIPVDVYIGGIEHAIMHLLYARFVMRFIKKQYQLPQNCIQPFKELVVQGLVKGRTLALKENGKYISQKQFEQKRYLIDDVKITYEKMSKSKFNGLNPNILVDKFGSDALRTSLFFANPPDRDIDFSEQIVSNALKFLGRIETVWKQLSFLPSTLSQPSNSQLLPKQQLLKLKNIFQKMQISIEKRLMHTYVANVMEMFNLIKDFVELESNKTQNANKVKLFAIFVRVLRIIAPQLSKDLQNKLVIKFNSFIKQQQFEKWPNDQLFGEKIQIMVMKGNKMIAKDNINIEAQNEQIQTKLNIQGKVKQIKRQKKKFIVILKD